MRALVRNRAKAPTFAAFPTVEVVEGDMMRPETLTEALSGLSAADVGTPFVFGSMHAEIERHLEGSGLSWTHLRPSQFMTEYLREVPTILAQSAFLLPLEDAKLVPVDVTDIATAAYRLLTTPGHEKEIYAMSGPEALTMGRSPTRSRLPSAGRCATSASLEKREGRRCRRREFPPFSLTRSTCRRVSG